MPSNNRSRVRIETFLPLLIFYLLDFSMPRRFYTLFFYLVMPLILLRLAYRAIRAPEYGRRINERFALFSAPSFDRCIWVHAVSVGETIAAVPLIRRLQKNYPNCAIVVTTMTPTGSERVEAMLGKEVFHVYAPYDIPGSVKRFLSRINPDLLIIMETELWPNTIHYCHKNSIPVVLANARLSERSAKGYGRVSSLSRLMLEEMSCIAAQHSADGERFVALGLPPENVIITGSIKFDIDIPAELSERARHLKTHWSHVELTDLGLSNAALNIAGSSSGNDDSPLRRGGGNSRRLIFIAASTHEGEEGLILSAFKRVLAQRQIDETAKPLLILVPRHPERFSRVVAMSEQLDLETVRRSSGESVRESTQVMVGDTMGELLLLYGCADIAFVGGSLVDNGGHNMLEAAAWALPIISGNSMHNFYDISQKFLQARALLVVNSEDELFEQLQNLLEDQATRQQMGRSALEVIEQNRGSLKALEVAISHYID